MTEEDIKDLRGGLFFDASFWFWKEIPTSVRDNPALRALATERAACVAYAEMYTLSINLLAHPGTPKASIGIDPMAAPEAICDVSKADLEDWYDSVRGRDRSDWFYVLFLNVVLESGLLSSDEPTQ